MQRHHADPGVFIRSMASRGKLGGLVRGTLEMALLLDAAGRNYVLIETVGVGQEEVDIARLAECATKAAPIRRIVTATGAGVGDLLQVIHDVYAAYGNHSRSVAAWSGRLRELRRDELLESLPPDALEDHAGRVAEKIEDPYTALAALTRLVRKIHGR